MIIFLAYRAKLDASMQQWQGYDDLYEGLSKWLKDTEVKVRTESGLRPDLATKQQQLDTFKARSRYLFITSFTVESCCCSKVS